LVNSISLGLGFAIQEPYAGQDEIKRRAGSFLHGLEIGSLYTGLSVLNPKVIIPMHYKTGKLDYPIQLLMISQKQGNVHRLETFEVEIDKSNIDNYKGIIVFPL